MGGEGTKRLERKTKRKKRNETWKQKTQSASFGTNLARNRRRRRERVTRFTRRPDADAEF